LPDLPERRKRKMRTMEWKLENGGRLLVNLDRIDAIVEHGINPSSQTVICIGGEEYIILGKYDEVIKQISFQQPT
jgi:uncharacterized protein YlzI (FlbEa/FlbD family)